MKLEDLYFNYYGGGGSQGATKLLLSETNGFALDFSDDSLVVKDTTTPSNNYTGSAQAYWKNQSLTAYSSPSPKYVLQSNGLLGYAPHNLIVMSEKMNSGQWTLTRATITADQTVAPDGTTTADLLKEDNTATNTHQIATTNAVTTATGQQYTYSCYFKAKERTWVMLYNSTLSKGYSFDIGNGVLGSVTGGALDGQTITSVGNGWYRCTLTFTSAAGSVGLQVRMMTDTSTVTYSGDNTSGLYMWGAQLNNGPVATTYVKTQNHNLCLQSQAANTSWATSNASVTADSTAAPDGITTADTVVPAATTNVHAISQTITVLANTTYTYSAYLKPSGYNFVALTWHDGATTAGHECIQMFDLNNGILASTYNVAPLSTTMTKLANGWYRCSITTSFATTSGNLAIFPLQVDQSPRSNSTGDGTSGCFVWGMQVELATTIGKYVPTTTTAVFSQQYNLPYEWTTAGAPLGMSAEPSVTNLTLQSQILDNAAWSKGACSITADQAVSPDGTTTGDLITEDGTTAGHILSGTSVAVTSASIYTASIFLKAGTRRYAMLAISGTGFTTTSYGVDLQTGLAAGTPTGTALTPLITSYGNGWYRVSFSLAATSTANGGLTIYMSQDGNWANRNYAGDSVSNLYAWGGQFELNTYASSYIPTGSATVTRNVDNITVASTLAPTTATAVTAYAKGNSFISSFTGTVTIRNSSGGITDTMPDMALGTGGGGGNGFGRSATRVGGATQADTGTSGTFVTNTIYKVATAIAIGDQQSCANGTLAIVGTPASLPSVVLDQLQFANRNNTASLCGHMLQAMILPRRMTNGELQTVTT